MRKYLLLLILLCSISAESGDKFIERQKAIELYFEKCSISNDSAFYQVCKNLDFSQIEYNQYDGYYSNTIDVKGVDLRNITYSITILKEEITIEYYEVISFFAGKTKKENDITEYDYNSVTYMNSWRFSIDEKNNIKSN